jgi:hypothetical protein
MNAQVAQQQQDDQHQKNKQVRIEEKQDSLFATLIAIALLSVIVAISFETQEDYVLWVPVLLSCPVVIYEFVVWCKDIYHNQFGKIEVAVEHTLSHRQPPLKQQKRWVLLFIRILYSFTFITFAAILAFFTYETFESSYYGSKTTHDMEYQIVSELKSNLLNRFCCPKKNVTHTEMHEYLRTQITSVLLHCHIRNNDTKSINKTPSSSPTTTTPTVHNHDFGHKVEDLITRVFDVLEHNTGFKYHTTIETWEWMFDFKPVDVLKVCHITLTYFQQN